MCTIKSQWSCSVGVDNEAPNDIPTLVYMEKETAKEALNLTYVRRLAMDREQLMRLRSTIIDTTGISSASTSIVRLLAPNLRESFSNLNACRTSSIIIHLAPGLLSLQNNPFLIPPSNVLVDFVLDLPRTPSLNVFELSRYHNYGCRPFQQSRVSR